MTDDTGGCPSRFFYTDHRGGPSIMHCDGRTHERGLRLYHSAPGLGWSDDVAMPAERPCDRRCARCVGRARDAVLDAALAWHDNPSGDGILANAVGAYRKVMGL